MAFFVAVVRKGALHVLGGWMAGQESGIEGTMKTYLLAALVLLPVVVSASESDDHFVTFSGGIATTNALGEIMLGETDFEDTYLGALGVGTTFAKNDKAALEGHAVMVKYAGHQHNFELNAAPVVRWKAFPWNDTVKTSVAAGVGLSYGLGKPKFEYTLGSKGSARLLTYLPVEATFAKPNSPWEGTVQIHHRSTAYGFFAEEGGANHLMLGVRKRF